MVSTETKDKHIMENNLEIVALGERLIKGDIYWVTKGRNGSVGEHVSVQGLPDDEGKILVMVESFLPVSGWKCHSVEIASLTWYRKVVA
jgi:hypothetical protein